jgi:hypothetical protein
MKNWVTDPEDWLTEAGATGETKETGRKTINR